MFALLKDVPVVNHPVFRIVLGVAVLVLAVAVLHDSIILIAIGALVLVMSLARGVRTLTVHTQKEQLR